MKNRIVVISILLLFFLQAWSQQIATGDNQVKMEWWRNAKFGMFIHWGIYSVNAGMWEEKTDGAEWMMNSRRISRPLYASYVQMFNPVKFNADEWVQLAKDAGQKYLVITAKHHDGFAMYKSKVSDYNVYDGTPFKRDVVGELSAACQKKDMNFGVYYSQALDWYHPGGTAHGSEWDPAQVGSTDKYIDEVSVPQVQELLNNYRNIKVFWWDQGGNMKHEHAAKLAAVLKQHPSIITNNRLGGGFEGDIITPEQFIPATGYPGKNWEVCMTMNNHWGYSAYDENWKPTKELLLKLVEIVSKGGNFLLNVGPNRYGVIPEICQRELREIGRWLNKNGESIYGTESSPFPYLSFGRSTRKGNKLYLHILQWNRMISVPCELKVKRAYLLADSAQTNIKSFSKDGYTYFKLPEYAPDRTDAVLAVECQSPVTVQAIPTQGLPMYAGGNKIQQLNDGDFHSEWSPNQNRAVIEFSLPEAQHIQCLGSVEPWSSWSGIYQTYRVEAMVNGQWSELASGHSDGTGITLPFHAVKAKQFRITVSNTKSDIKLEELMLFN
jgi:alpha-L-fucosidase